MVEAPAHSCYPEAVAMEQAQEMAVPTLELEHGH